ncbi:MAG: hypothetical protein JO314_00460 [Acidobacteria bacterium]|nr:hypothetical protein [Acidobacteriota bacterium]
MKYCPTCGTKFDEEVIQFCTKDGSPLVEEDAPRFTAMPSENSDDLGEDTVIRRREESTGTTQTERGERIVIPATPTEPRRDQQVRTRPAAAYYAPRPQPPNTGKVVALTILGTVAAIGFGALLFWALSRGGQTSNINVNTNPPNANMNANGFDSNFNFNANVTLPPVNFNAIGNMNANVKSPTPTPKPSPSPTASVVPTETPERTPRPTPSGTPRPSATPTPRTGPRPPGNMTGN